MAIVENHLKLVFKVESDFYTQLRRVSAQLSPAPLYQKVQPRIHLLLQFVVVLHFRLDSLEKGLINGKLLQQLNVN